jgi:hypothetical protein
MKLYYLLFSIGIFILSFIINFIAYFIFNYNNIAYCLYISFNSSIIIVLLLILLFCLSKFSLFIYKSK